MTILGEGIATTINSEIRRVHSLGTPEYFRRSAKEHRCDYERRLATKSKRGAKRAKMWMEKEAAAIEPSRAYWSEVERITRESGITAAKNRKTDAEQRLHGLVDSILTHEEKTVTGLIIKAEALQAWGKVEPFRQFLNEDAPRWASAFAETVMRQTKTGAIQ